MGSLVGLTIWSRDYSNATDVYQADTSNSRPMPDRMVAYFSMIHVGIWIIVGIFDRYMWCGEGMVDFLQLCIHSLNVTLQLSLAT